MLREAMNEAGMDPARIEVREIDTDESAKREEFLGSPTIRIDGADVQPLEGRQRGSPAGSTGAATGGPRPCRTPPISATPFARPHCPEGVACRRWRSR